MRKFQKINYKDLSPKQQENYNFHKVSSILADYGFTTIKLYDDWKNADFIAQHNDRKTFLKVQLKSRFSIEKKYMSGDEIFISFPKDETPANNKPDKADQTVIDDLLEVESDGKTLKNIGRLYLGPECYWINSF